MLEIIEATAHELRAAFDVYPRQELPVQLQHFPSGACEPASIMLGILLDRRGVNDLHLFNWVSAEGSHAWLQQGSLVIDITADQFGCHLAPVIVSESSHWHAELGGHDSGVLNEVGFDGYQVRLLIMALDDILAGTQQTYPAV